MKVRLNYRKDGCHAFIKECEIEGTFRRYGKQKVVKGHPFYIPPTFTINEERLLDALPKDFLMSEPGKTLITVSEGSSGTGIDNLSIFRSWAKYFSSYSLELVKK